MGRPFRVRIAFTLPPACAHATHPAQANPQKLELNNPELALNVGVRWSIGDCTLNTAHQYMGEQALPGVEIENEENFTLAFADETWIHNASIRWDPSDQHTVTVGIINLSNEEPYVASVATRVSALRRYFFLRLTASY